MSKISVGVIVGRFQTPELTNGHKQLIAEVLTKHQLVIVFVGNSPLLLSKRNPLPYIVREQMIRTTFPTISVHPLQDCKVKDDNDRRWDNQLDNRIKELAPYANITLYGSRDSFLQTYKGIHKKEIIVEAKSPSGTEMRLACAMAPINSSDFRRGIIFSNFNHWPISYATVDVAIYNEEGKWLVGQKYNQDQYRFVGGFSDPEDDSFEMSARRETGEETGLTIEEDDLEYVCSRRIRDWRYESEEDKIKTILYKVKAPAGVTPLGADDIRPDSLAWFTLDEMKELAATDKLVGEHKILLECLIKHLNKQKK